jgi:ribonucleoside-diphosphate reductase alpha chain
MENHERMIPLLSSNAETILKTRYLKKDHAGQATESPADMFRRVAVAIAEVEKQFHAETDIPTLANRFYSLMANLEFLPNSPTLMNAGRELVLNCVS